MFPSKKNILSVSLQKEYLEALIRWKELNPTVLNVSYEKVSLDLLKGKVVIFDPPYEGSQASYNSKFDYHQYWNYLNEAKKVAKIVIVFDRSSNLEKQNIPVIDKRKMRVNGLHAGDSEGLAIYENGEWLI